MFNFINSLALPLLAAALIPIILHLLNRQKLKTIPFSSIKFLKELQSKRIRQVKIYQILIILIRMLFIIFLVLAFARPTLKSLFSSTLKGARTTAVILLDNSLSMQARTSVQSNFEKATNLVQQVLSSYQDQDQVFIITGDLNSEQPIQINFNESFELSQLKVSNFNFNFGLAVQKSAQLFAEFPNFNKELILISDARQPAKSVSDSSVSLLKKLQAKVFLIKVSFDEPFENLSLDSAAILSGLIELHQPVRLQALIRNQGDESKESYISLFNGPNRLAMQLVKIAPHATKSVELVFSPNTTGQYDLVLELDDDHLLLDNNYYLTLDIPKEIRILYVYHKTEPEVLAALQTISAKGNFRITPVKFSEWLAQPLSEYQLLIFDDPVNMGQAPVNILNQFLKMGKNLVVIPGLSSSLTEYNQLLERLTLKKPFIDFQKRQSDDQFFSLKQTSAGWRLLKPVFQPNVEQVELPVFYQYFKMRKMGTLLFEFSNGDPLLQILDAKAKGKVFLLSSGLSHQWGNFPLHGLFVPFLHQLLAMATYTVDENLQTQIGRPLTITLPQVKMKGNFQLIKPDQQKVNIIPEQTDYGLTFTFEGFGQPGHYKIANDGQSLKTFAVNLNSAEWQEPFLNLKQIRPDLIQLSAEDFNAQTLSKARIGRELWPWFLGLALLMLALEMWLIRKLEQG